MAKVIYCPVNGYDCVYYDANGCCMMYPDQDPLKNCEDFATFWDEGDDYVCDPELEEALYEEESREKENLRDKHIYEEDYDDDYDEVGYDPYMGCYTDDC